MRAITLRVTRFDKAIVEQAKQQRHLLVATDDLTRSRLWGPGAECLDVHPKPATTA